MIDVPLQFVVGKGGVGKSTVTVALAMASAARGLRTLLVEFGGAAGAARLLGRADAPTGQPGEAAPNLWQVSLAGDEALAEYLAMVLPIRRLLAAVTSSRLYGVFVDGAPGLKELMTVGKVWYEATRVLPGGRPAWDRIYVDAGASGHSLAYLQMPRAAAATFSSGLVHREATRVHALLSDPARCRVHVVATPEEMPANEAVEIVARLRGELGLALGTLFVNRCRRPSPAGAAAAVDAIARVAAQGGAQQGLLALATAAGRAALGWEAVQEASLARLERDTSLVPLRLPLLAREEFGRAEAAELAGLLAAAEASS